MKHVSTFLLGFILLITVVAYAVNSQPDPRYQLAGDYIYAGGNPNIRLTDTLTFDGRSHVRLGSLVGEIAVGYQISEGYVYLSMDQEASVPLRIVTADSLYGNSYGCAGWYVRRL